MPSACFDFGKFGNPKGPLRIRRPLLLRDEPILKLNKRRYTPSKIITVGFFGSVSRETDSDRSGRISISNCPFIRAMKSLSGVAKRCIGSTIEDRSRRVISDIPSSDSVYVPSIGTMTMSKRPIAA